MIEEAIANIAIVSTLLPILFGVKYWKAIDFPLKWVFYIACVSLICDIVGTTIRELGYMNIFVISIYQVCFFTFIFLYFRKILQVRKKIVLQYIIFALLASFITWYTLFADSFNSFTNCFRARGVIGYVAVALGIAYLFQQIRSLKQPYIERDPHFWIVSGLIIQYSTSFIISIFADLPDVEDWFTYYSFSKNSTFIVMNILFVIGFRTAHRWYKDG